jgi:hypothetical protein
MPCRPNGTRSCTRLAEPKEVDRTCGHNKTFWAHALSAAHYPGANIILEDCHVTEWLPFAPGRYFTDGRPRNATLHQGRPAPPHQAPRIA